MTASSGHVACDAALLISFFSARQDQGLGLVSASAAVIAGGASPPRAKWRFAYHCSHGACRGCACVRHTHDKESDKRFEAVPCSADALRLASGPACWSRFGPRLAVVRSSYPNQLALGISYGHSDAEAPMSQRHVARY